MPRFLPSSTCREVSLRLGLDRQFVGYALHALGRARKAQRLGAFSGGGHGAGERHDAVAGIDVDLHPADGLVAQQLGLHRRRDLRVGQHAGGLLGGVLGGVAGLLGGVLGGVAGMLGRVASLLRRVLGGVAGRFRGMLGGVAGLLRGMLGCVGGLLRRGLGLVLGLVALVAGVVLEHLARRRAGLDRQLVGDVLHALGVASDAQRLAVLGGGRDGTGQRDHAVSGVDVDLQPADG